MKSKVLLVFAVVMYSIITAFAQNYPKLQFRNLSKDFQFSHDETAVIKQDSVGYIWICNRGGLDRFDGVEVKSYRFNSSSAHSLSSNYVTNVHFNSNGTMFVGTRSELNFFDPASSNFYPIPLPMPREMKVKYYSINSYVKENDDLYWVTTSAGLFKGVPSKMQFERIPFRMPYEYEHYHNFMFGIDQDVHGNLWIASWAGLFKYDVAQNKFKLYPIQVFSPQPQNFSVLSYLKFGPNGKLYITSWSEGLFELDTAQMKAKQYFFISNGEKIGGEQNLMFLGNELYVATVEGGVAVFRDGKYKTYPRKMNLPGSICSGNTFSIFIDRDSMMWVATHDGISTASKNSFVEESKFYYADPEKIWFNTPHSLVKLDSINYLADTYDGIYLWNSESGAIERAEKYKQLPPNAVEGAFKHKSGDKYYYKHRNQLYLYTIKNGYISEPETLFTLPDGAYFHQFEEDKNGGFWLSFYIGLGYYNPKTGEYLKWNKDSGKNFRINNTIIHTFHYDKYNHQLWFSEEDFGLVKMDCATKTAQFYNKKETPKFFDNIIVSALQLNKNQILFGTRSDGIYNYDYSQNEFHRLVGSNSIIGNEIYQIDRIYPQQILIKSAAGIFMYNLVSRQLQSLLKSNGIYNIPSMAPIFLCSDQKLYFFDGNNVMSIINPANIKTIKPPKTPYLEGLTVAGEEFQYQVGSILKLPSNRNSIGFSFTQFDYENPGFVSFIYELEGSENSGKIMMSNKLLNFANLSPGDYTLRVWSRGITGLTSDLPIVIPISIQPPFYATWWFILLVLIFLMSVFYTIYRIRLAKILEIQEIRNKLARDLHDDVGSTLSGISMYSKIAKELATKDAKKSLEILDNIGEKSRSTLENISDIVWHINPENDSVERIVVRMKNFGVELFDNSDTIFDFNTDGLPDDVKLSLEVKKNLFLLYKEAINNALKYSKASKVKVKLYIQKKFIHMDIEDNGVGFDFITLKRVNGINNMRKRAELCQGSFIIISEPNSGTSIRCKFPTM